jgi:hypothetical protein
MADEIQVAVHQRASRGLLQAWYHRLLSYQMPSGSTASICRCTRLAHWSRTSEETGSLGLLGYTGDALIFVPGLGLVVCAAL